MLPWFWKISVDFALLIFFNGLLTADCLQKGSHYDFEKHSVLLLTKHMTLINEVMVTTN